ncbi:MAG: glycoside hydrolase family 127 protein [Opitutaceae bacterium]|nr:glycoside hydrolase family 127 protein [Opitutaceae bacterium]
MTSIPTLVGRLLVLASVALSCTVRAGERGLIDTTRSPSAKMYMTDLADVRWTEGFWAERFDVCRTTMVPHLWTIFSSEKDSHAWANYRIAAGLQPGKFAGPTFNDGDFLKWLEALAQIYAVTRDPAIDRQMDEIIAVVAKAQREDGYLHTRTIIPQRQGNAKAKEFADRDHFETYNMGHLMTAACVHYRATGKTTLLACARKAADYIERLCATAPADLARNAICPSHYMGVVELYRATREPRYLELAKQLIEIRSLVPADVGSDMNQDRMPFRQMTEAVGHAVRANYLYAGAADVFAESGDVTLFKTLAAISENVAGRKLAITGATGALYDGASPDGGSKHSAIKKVDQAYGRDYQLPNLTAYNESCATVGYVMWEWRMFTLTGAAHHADLFEQALYNGVLPAISLEGKDYLYVNALKKLHDFKWPMRWSRTRTPNIKSSFCCPPNVVRMIAQAHNYAYSLSPDAFWVNLYGASTLDTAWTDGSRIVLKQETDYPWSGTVRLTIGAAPTRDIALKLRIPGWLPSGAATLQVNGQPIAGELTPGSYCEVKRTWKAGDVVTLALNFQPALWEANPLVEETLNQLTVRHGPLVYCLESNDLPEGVRLTDVALALDKAHGRFEPRRETIAGANVVTLTLPAFALDRRPWAPGQLYRAASTPTPREFPLKLVPYFAWGNRGDTEMSVWMPQR